jgi:predicted Zn finger-like uncharacterized protein
VHTQCPDCKTKFLINDDQLRVAQGKVRCSKCHKVFNALESLQKPPQTAAAPISEQPKKLPDSVTDFMSEADLEEFAELKAKISDDLNPDKKSVMQPKTPEQQQEVGKKIDDDLSDVLKELERMEKQSKDESEAPEETTAILEPEPLPEAVTEKIDDSPKPILPNDSKSTTHDPMELLTPKKPPK